MVHWQFHYRARIYSFPQSPINESISSYPPCDREFLTSWPYKSLISTDRHQQYTATCQNDEITSIRTDLIELPGNSEFDWFGLSTYGRFLYKRHNDVVEFRISDRDVGSILGPLKINKRTQLVLMELYNPKPETSITVLSIQARKNKDANFEFFMTIYYKATKLSVWEQFIIYETVASPTHIIDENIMITADQSHLYFLKTPLNFILSSHQFYNSTIATGNRTQTISFIFLKSIFTLDYALTTAQSHGYSLQPLRRIVELQSSSLTMVEMFSDTTRTTLVGRNEIGDVFVFRRERLNVVVKVPSPVAKDTTGLGFLDDGGGVRLYVFSFQGVVLELAVWALVEVVWPRLKVLFFGKEVVKVNKFVEREEVVESWGPWHLERMWNSPHIGAEIKAQALVDQSILPLEVLQSLAPEQTDPQFSREFISYFYENNGSLVLLDLNRSFEGSYFWNFFVLRQWDMIAAMLGVIGAFILNEL
ncbi:hypothetical protein HK096_004414, partial [Nowakowskiella sp. JEL0078]